MDDQIIGYELSFGHEFPLCNAIDSGVDVALKLLSPVASFRVLKPDADAIAAAIVAMAQYQILEEFRERFSVDLLNHLLKGVVDTAGSTVGDRALVGLRRGYYDDQAEIVTGSIVTLSGADDGSVKVCPIYMTGSWEVLVQEQREALVRQIGVLLAA